MHCYFTSTSSRCAGIFLLYAVTFNHFIVSINAIKNINIESFGDIPTHSWYALNDPVMGGLSTGTATVENGLGVFKGEVIGVPKLDDAPGFIAMMTVGGYFPDLSSCQSIKLTVKDIGSTPYKGYRVSFGTNHPSGSMPYASGYKTRMELSTVGEWTEVVLPFTDFSDYWDAKTGNQIVTCKDDNQYCPDETTLRNLLRLEIMAEGVLGKIHLKVASIDAMDCSDDDVQETSLEGANGDKRWNGQGSSHGQGEDLKEVVPVILENGDIRIESFSDPQHTWFSLNDPVMGGESTSTVVIQNDIALFDGEVVDVPFLSAPGFIKMETRGGGFPDVSNCKALKINVMAQQEYDGLRATFGVHHREEAGPYVRGYKAHFSAPVGSFDDVIIPFSEFSDNWDPLTGDVIVSCAEDSKYCANTNTLRDLSTFSIMGEGVGGKIHLEVKSVYATDCSKRDDSDTKRDDSDTERNDLDSNGNTRWIVILVLGSFAFGGFVAGAFYAGKQHGMTMKDEELEMGEVRGTTNAQIS